MEKEAWEVLGNIDPKFAIASDSSKIMGGWSNSDFFELGEKIVEGYLSRIKPEFGSALDFGCGVGRLTKAISGRFREVHGVDVSSSMLAQAKLNCPNVTFHCSQSPDFNFGSFDFVVAHHVLQHVGRRDEILAYIDALCRSTKGILVFNIPTYLPIKMRFQIRIKIYKFGVFLGFSPSFLYRIGLRPIRMGSIESRIVEERIKHCGLSIVEAYKTTYPSGQISITYYCKCQDT